MRPAHLAHNDPYGEHDFGSFRYAGETIFWKFDYYDVDLQMHSPDPSDPTVKWSCFSGQVCGLSKMHLVSVYAAFRVSALPKYAMSGVRLSRAV